LLLAGGKTAAQIKFYRSASMRGRENSQGRWDFHRAVQLFFRRCKANFYVALFLIFLLKLSSSVLQKCWQS
jgi:hypothetical protein